MAKYTKALSALGAGLLVAIPSLVAAGQDGHVSLQEWLTVLGLFVPAVVVALSPANTLGENQLVQQVLNNPSVDKILAKLHVSPQNLLRALRGNLNIPPVSTTTTGSPSPVIVTEQK
jgi:hypothetical protein